MRLTNGLLGSRSVDTRLLNCRRLRLLSLRRRLGTTAPEAGCGNDQRQSSGALHGVTGPGPRRPATIVRTGKTIDGTSAHRRDKLPRCSMTAVRRASAQCRCLDHRQSLRILLPRDRHCSQITRRRGEGGRRPDEKRVNETSHVASVLVIPLTPTPTMHLPPRSSFLRRRGSIPPPTNRMHFTRSSFYGR